MHSIYILGSQSVCYSLEVKIKGNKTEKDIENTFNLRKFSHGEESTVSMGTLKEMAYLVRRGPLPRLPSLKYVPVRYRRWLPLSVAKRYQCLVIGAAQGVATVALARPGDAAFYTLLEEITTCTVFPVLVPPSSLRLAIKRLERDQRRLSLSIHPTDFLPPYQIRTLSQLSLFS